MKDKNAIKFQKKKNFNQIFSDSRSFLPFLDCSFVFIQINDRKWSTIYQNISGLWTEWSSYLYLYSLNMESTSIWHNICTEIWMFFLWKFCRWTDHNCTKCHSHFFLKLEWLSLILHKLWTIVTNDLSNKCKIMFVVHFNVN